MSQRNDELKPGTKPEHHRFHFLDALRGVAAILVISRHAPNQFGHSLISHNNFMAVDFFFCLSGFVIAFSYEKRLASSLRFANFVVTRMIRFVPIAALGTFLGAIVFFGVSQHMRGYTAISITPKAALFDLLLGSFVLPQFSLTGNDVGFFPLDGVMWTLMFEIIANVVYAALVRLRIAHSWIFLFISTFSLVLLSRECKIQGTLDYGYSQFSFFIGLARVCFSFFAGVLMYRLHIQKARVNVHGKRAVLTTVAATAAFILALYDPMPLSHTVSSELIIISVFFPLIIYFGANVVVPKKWIPIFALLGTVSYPLYLLHPPLVWLLTKASYLHFAAVHQSIATFVMLAYIAAIFGLAWLCAEFYDGPVRRRMINVYRTYLTNHPS